MKKPEILSPAGNMECLKAAVIAGCDAVYLGGYIFGARAFSNNFSNEEIIEAVEYAHSYNVKVYVTVNTLIYENEVETFMTYIDFLYTNNVDAVIVQDIGMMDLIRQVYPNFDVHASTQMHIHNLEGVKLVKELGLTRCVLARETPIELIEKIKKEVDIELEIFVHGALCISYSGQCLMSSLIGNRSGNRGTCAGTCRQQYDVIDENNNKVNKDKYNLSTKDLNSLENISRLIEAGVDSFKIEGRMKSPSYVYLVTKMYRIAIDSYIKTGKVKIDNKILNDVKKTFNRLFTKGFLFNEENNNIINPYRPNHLGIEIGKVVKVEKNKIYIKLTDTLNINDGIRFIGSYDEGLIVTKMEKGKHDKDVVIVFSDKKIDKNSIVVKTTDYKLNKEIECILQNEIRKVKIDTNLEIKLNEKMKLLVTDGINKVTLESDNIIESSINNPTDKEMLIKQLNKTGSTIFEMDKINISLDDNVFVPVKEINELRRNALEVLLKTRINSNNRKYIKNEYHRQVIEYPNTKYKSVYVLNKDLYEKVKDKHFDIIYAPLKYDDNITLKLPRVVEKHEEYKERLLVGELGSINKYKDCYTDFSLNVVNSYSVALLNNLGVKRITLSYELNDEQIIDIIESYKERYKKNPSLALIIYAKEEMMISKFNLLKYYNLKNSAYLKDKFNNLYRIVVNDNLMYIYNYKARNLKDIDKYFNMGINELRYNIIDKEDLKNI